MAAVLCTFTAFSQYSTDTTYKVRISPFQEIKKGVILQSTALAGFAISTIIYVKQPPKEPGDYQTYGIAYGASAVMFFVGTLYVVQGLNYMYKPNNMGHWSLNVAPTGATIAMRF